MTRSLRPAAALALAVLLAAGCASDSADSSGGSATTPASAATATPSGPVVTWAGQVCSSVDDLTVAVTNLGAVLPTDQAAARAELKTRVDTVHQAADALAATLRQPPAEGGEALTATRDSLSAAADGVQTKVDAMSQAADQAAAAPNEAAAESALKQLRGAALEAQTALRTYGTELRGALSDSTAAVQAAFQAAPSCQEIPSTATP